MTLRVLSYNIWGIPCWVAGSPRKKRISQMSPKLNRYDLVAIQENYYRSPYLLSQVTHEHTQHFLRATRRFRISGAGLSLLSGYPLEHLDEISWDNCNGVFGAGNDCIATKGVQAVRISLDPSEPDLELDVYNIHLDAGKSLADQLTRESQIEQFLLAIAKHSADKAVLILGDSNLKRDDTGRAIDRRTFKRLLDSANLTDGCQAVSCPQPALIDIILFRGSERVSIRPLEWQQATEFRTKDGEELSDHPAISMQFLIELK